MTKKYLIRGLLIGIILGIILMVIAFYIGRGDVVYPLFSIETLTNAVPTLLYHVVLPPAILGLIIGWIYGRKRAGMTMK